MEDCLVLARAAVRSPVWRFFGARADHPDTVERPDVLVPTMLRFELRLVREMPDGDGVEAPEVGRPVQSGQDPSICF